ncbi:ornithine cyclodeaminase family protein [Enterococcus dongliensis]|uniref:Ornithine cyclodeaminase family protein n=1 Tax=Enterococcus dongliensis TaxID=2559925 RepID=A0AAW8TMV0_9ENTE|nr:ornithine cyclodeaminase family protein [Enterococcus dongliensis]MDT2597967.1 ornithine cyclodeaminase family protein [Enterococcus dongliensis]MDT2604850.1 ornithine cyclodeaminase family protein [Enterococcus dongliensis]MDT2635803.1 ornithine cyclodeaminase family protein [Enterococcus dongliensis]MDT2638370.1 ornithine cyclodeaminase family protein [Enterococcus dongliensis]MDT2640982.1 ornithine cyclodeaminase family protein [Enterococcus dongliensis]
MLLLSRDNINQVFTMKDAIEADKVAFRLFSENKTEVPLRTQIVSEKQNGTFLFMPSYAPDLDAAALKIINIFPDNIDKGLASAPAQVLLVDGKTGYVNALLDGVTVTQLRTGAASGVAFDLLGRREAKKGALIGTGGQAATQLEAMICARELESVYVFDQNLERTKAFATQMTEKLKDYHTKILPASTSDEAISDADLIITVTPATKPVFDGKKVKAGATISCVGSYQPQMQEMDPVILERASKIYFDSEEAVLSESGDILIPLNDGTITKDDFTGDIGDLLLEKISGRENEEEIIVFKTVGIGAQDLVTAQKIYERALEEKIGTEWS